MCHFDTDDYYVAEVDGQKIVFVSYAEYLEYLEDEKEESEEQ